METNDSKIYNRFKVMKNNVRREIRKIRRLEQISVAQYCKSNPIAFWSYIKKRNQKATALLMTRKIPLMMGMIR